MVVRNLVPAPTIRKRILRQRPNTASSSYSADLPNKSLKRNYCNVKIAEWSSSVPIDTIASDRRYLYRRTSLFPADGERRQLKNYSPVPSASSGRRLAVKRRPLQNLKKKHSKMDELRYSPAIRARAATLGIPPKIHACRRRLEKEVLDLAASKLVDLTAPAEHKSMLCRASHVVSNYTNNIKQSKDKVGMEIRKSKSNKIMTKGASGPADKKLIDIRTHGKIFRSFIPFEAQWLDMWGAQDTRNSNCNAHCVRALYKWEEVKAAGRCQTNLRRASQAQKSKGMSSRRRKSHAKRRNGEKNGAPASIAGILAETERLLKEK